MGEHNECLRGIQLDQLSMVDIVCAAAAEDPVEVGTARPVGVDDGADGERGVPRQALKHGLFCCLMVVGHLMAFRNVRCNPPQGVRRSANC